MRVYSTREAAELLDMPQRQIRSLARAGFVTPTRSDRGHYRFDFQDLVLLRAAKGLGETRLGNRRVLRALRALAARLPSGRPMSSVRVMVDGDRVLVRDRRTAWEPESGQTVLDFSLEQLAQKVAPLVRASAEAAAQNPMDAEQWFDVGLELDHVGASRDAEAAYRRALAADPLHVNAKINLGRLLHAQRAFKEAEKLYREALRDNPGHPVAQFNLGVVLEDQGAIEAAMENYRIAVESEDTDIADAHYNLARLYELQGDRQSALRHLSRFKVLSERRTE
jgi:tetratricopeptide (TPR) repeat protein